MTCALRVFRWHVPQLDLLTQSRVDGSIDRIKDAARYGHRCWHLMYQADVRKGSSSQSDSDDEA